MLISHTVFEGLVPRTSSRLLGTNQAQTAENVDLTAGNLRPLYEPSTIEALSDSSQQTIFSYRGAWLSWSTDVDVTQSVIQDDQYDRIQYTGDGGNPKQRGLVSGTATEYDLGVPAPTNTLSVASAAKSTVTWTRTWRYQYEEPNGNIGAGGTLASGTVVLESVVGKVYYIMDVDTSCPRGGATNDAQLVILFDGADASSNNLGRLYSSNSKWANDADINNFKLDGAVASAALVVDETKSGAGSDVDDAQVTFTITYDTSRASDYNVTTSYVETLINVWGEEGPPGDASADVDRDPTQDVVISSLTTSVSGNYNIAGKRLYRVVTTLAGDNFQLINSTDIALATASYTDTTSDGNLPSTLLTSTDYSLPANDLKGLTVMPGGFLAGFDERTVYFSEVEKPHAWPYGLTVDHDIVAIGVTQNALIVTTDGPTYAMVGDTPAAMQRVRGSLQEPCVSKRSMAKLGDLLIYAGPTGLIAYAGTIGVNITARYYRKEQWAALSPSTMVGVGYDQKYYGWTSAGAIILDPDSEGSSLTTTTETVNGVRLDDDAEVLYLIQGSNITQWEGSSTRMTGKWKGKLHQLAAPSAPVAVRIACDTYTASTSPKLLVYAKETLVKSQVFKNRIARKIATLKEEYEWEFEIQTNSPTHEFSIGGSIDELKLAA